MHGQTIQRLLWEKAGGPDADSSAIAEAADLTCRRAASELAKVIGVGGVSALYSRSLRITESRFPWLTTAGGPAPADAQFPNLKATLARRNPAEAIDASTALLVTFAELLVNLIGEAVSTRLLNAAWASGDPGTTTEGV